MQSQLNEMQSMRNQMQVQQNKMPISWQQLPLEMLEAVVIQMDGKLRGRFSMCSKLTNELVRGIKYGRVNKISINNDGVEIFFDFGLVKQWDNFYTKKSVFVKERDDGGSSVFLDTFYVTPSSEEKYSTATDWKETVLDILGMIGRVITVDTLELRPGSGFKERFKWFRDNLLNRVKLQRINIIIAHSPLDCYDESILDWPENIYIELYVRGNIPPNFELFNTYEKIVVFNTGNYSGRNPYEMTDEVLMKMINIRRFVGLHTGVTMNGVVWWLRKWISQKDDNEIYDLRVVFRRGSNEFSFENVKNRLSDVIGKTEETQEFAGTPEHCWQIEINKNGKVGGILILLDYHFHFCSYKIEPK